VTVTRSRQSAPCPAGVRAVHHQFDNPTGEPLQDHVDQLPRELGLGGAVRGAGCPWAKQAQQDRQRDGPAAQARQADDQHDHEPAVPPPGSPPRSLRLRAVVQVVRAPHPFARAAKQRVVDREPQHAVSREHRDQEVRQRQPELIGISTATSEEVVRTAVMPHPRQPRSLGHPSDRAIPRPGHRPVQQHAERLKARLGEASPQQGQHGGQRSGNLKHGGDVAVSRPRSGAPTPAADGLGRPPDSGSPPTLLRRPRVPGKDG